MEESEQDKNSREFEQTALKDILNSSAQGNKDRKDINSENNKEKINSNKRVSEESNESLLGKIVKRFKFKQTKMSLSFKIECCGFFCKKLK